MGRQTDRQTDRSGRETDRYSNFNFVNLCLFQGCYSFSFHSYMLSLRNKVIINTINIVIITITIIGIDVFHFRENGNRQAVCRRMSGAVQ